MNNSEFPRFIRNKITVITCTSSLADISDSDLAAKAAAANCSFRIILRLPASPYPVERDEHDCHA
ncbi:hypothetical protein [Yersinia pekkanenii]|uniref:Uncharacterized protein n=1 Tax=Yersinia pekkanenii TaxID=1288385 RepID=A0A0T9R221_9GAMM|nr:hypothetical protein [Yersinia pekkanenii]CNI39866.1 Uncharacterised protein [Yersinia pekkanenii]CRY69114.1 Uncharacterised protein [Yersinia pekkanenii]